MNSKKQRKIVGTRVRQVPRRNSVLFGRRIKAEKAPSTVEKAAQKSHGDRGDAQSSPSQELSRVRRGQMSKEEYLEARVEVALGPFKGRVSQKRLEMAREVVAERLKTDRVLLATQERLFVRKAKSGK